MKVTSERPAFRPAKSPGLVIWVARFLNPLDLSWRNRLRIEPRDLEVLRGMPSGAGAILVSNYADESDMRACLELSFPGCLERTQGLPYVLVRASRLHHCCVFPIGIPLYKLMYRIRLCQLIVCMLRIARAIARFAGAPADPTGSGGRPISVTPLSTLTWRSPAERPILCSPPGRHVGIFSSYTTCTVTPKVCSPAATGTAMAEAVMARNPPIIGEEG
jgi:hypothetical protein